MGPNLERMVLEKLLEAVDSLARLEDKLDALPTLEARVSKIEHDTRFVKAWAAGAFAVLAFCGTGIWWTVANIPPQAWIVLQGK